MARRTVDIVDEYCAAYLAREFEVCVGCYEDDIVSAINVDRIVVPFAGVTIGKAAALRRFNQINAMFDLIRYDPVYVRVDGERVMTRIAYRTFHRATGAELDGTLRMHWWMRGKRVMRAIHTHDRARFEAFFRLVAAE